MAATFLYETPVVEVLTLEPSAGPVAGGISVAVLGRGFQAGAGVTFGGVAATAVTVESSTRIVGTLPAHAAGVVAVVVTNPDTTAATFVDGFTYEATPPSQAIRFRTPGGTTASRIRLINAPHITQTLGQPASCTFTADVEPAGGSSVEFWAGGVALFRGTVTQKTERTNGKARRQVWDVEATDFAHWLGRVHPVGTWAAVSGTTVIGALLANAPGFSAAGVQGGLDPVTLELDGTADLWAAILDVASRCGAKAFLDGATLYVFTTASTFTPGPAAVTEGNGDLLWPDDGSQAVSIDWDYASIHNRVTVRGAEGIVATLEDGPSIAVYGVCGFVVNDNTLTTTAELVARAQTILASDAWPIQTAHYATRDVHTRAGAAVTITMTRPAISGAFIIHTVAIDQLEHDRVGTGPRFVVTAKPVAASFRARADLVHLLQTVVDLNANAAKQPRLDGEVVSTPGGRTTIPDDSIPATKLAGCIPSGKLTPTGVTPGTYGDSAHLAGFIVDEAGRLTAAATDPVAVAKTDGSQPYTADQPMGGHTLTDVADPVNPQDVATKAYVDAEIAGVGGGGSGAPAVTGEIPTGAINGVNLVFTTAAPYEGLRVYRNGQRLTLGDDYTETTPTTFTLAAAPHAPDVILVDYGDTAGGGGGGTSFTTGDGLVLATGVLDLVLDGASLTKSPTGLKVTATGGGGIVRQEVYTQTSAAATSATIIPFDDTIPQSSEGVEVLSRAITPFDAGSKLRITVSIFATVTATPWIIVALFRDAGANAIAAAAHFNPLGTAGSTLNFSWTVDAGATAATTFKVRIGPSSVATVTINGQSGGRIFGGTAISRIAVTEYTP